MTSTNPDLFATIDEAVLYAFPLFETARTRHRDFIGADGMPALAPNTLRHDRELSDHECRWITTPNNDTLYSRAWLDLSAGPIRIDIDRLPEGRYWSIAFLDAFTNNFAIVGQKLEGFGPLSLTLVGPGADAGLATGRVIRAPGNDVWLFARWLVDAEGDAGASHRMQACLRIDAPPASRGARALPVDPLDPASFVAVVSEQLARNPPPAADAAVLARIAAVGVRASHDSPWPALPELVRQAWTKRIAAAHQKIRESMPIGLVMTQQWRRRGGPIGVFGTNYVERATVALGGLGALPPSEAVYATRISDDDGSPLDGSKDFCLTVPASGVPADSFWSFSMYEPTADGRRFFVDNPIRRYSIGDRTPGLRYEADGSLRIWVQRQAPDDPARRANWLPAAAGAYVLSFRAYLPRESLRNWTCELPSLRRV